MMGIPEIRFEEEITYPPFLTFLVCPPPLPPVRFNPVWRC